MIISFKHNYIFIRTKKTGTSTIEEVLRPSLGPDDISTSRRMTDAPMIRPSTDGRPPFTQHMTVSEIIYRLPDGFWDKAFKFTVERHPYEKCVSFAFFRFGKADEIVGRGNRPPQEDFDAHLDQVVRNGKYASFRYYSINGKSMMDEIIHQENLGAEMKRIGERLGVPIPDELPRKKSSFRFDKRPAREILSQEQKDTVYENCRQEFELLGYER